MISAAGGAAVAAEDADWSGKQLTAMYHIQFLSLATTINLSNNALRRLDGFGLLLNVVELNLDNNNLEGTEEDLLFFLDGVYSKRTLDRTKTLVVVLRRPPNTGGSNHPTSVLSMSHFAVDFTLTFAVPMTLNHNEGIFSDELKGMKALKVLHLQNNQISTLRGLEGLKRVKLDQLTLTGNPVVGVEGFDGFAHTLAEMVGA